MSDYPVVIGLSGRKGAGKDFAANILVEEYGFTRLAFADKLKEVAYATNMWIDYGSTTLKYEVDTQGWDVVKNEYPEVREFLQNLGVACRDFLHENVWVHPIESVIVHGSADARYVITDVRFNNEQAMIHRLRGKLWKIVGDRYQSIDNHISEIAHEAFMFDKILSNFTTSPEWMPMAIRKHAEEQDW